MKLWTVKIILLITLLIIGTVELLNSKSVCTPTVVKDTITVDSLSIFLEGHPKQHHMDALRYYEVKHPEIVYAQAIIETGNFSSNGFKVKNNLFGIMKGRRLRTFNHWTESIVYYKNNIQNRYKSRDYYAFLKRIGYAEDPTYINKLKKVVNNNDKRRSKQLSPISD